MLYNAIKTRFRLALVLCLILTFIFPANMVFASNGTNAGRSDPTQPVGPVNNLTNFGSPITTMDETQVVSLVVGLINDSLWVVSHEELRGYSVPNDERKAGWLTEEVMDAWHGNDIVWMMYQRIGRTEPSWGNDMLSKTMMVVTKGKTREHTLYPGMQIVSSQSGPIVLEKDGENFDRVILSDGTATNPLSSGGGIHMEEIANALIAWFRDGSDEDPRDLVLSKVNESNDTAKQVLQYLHAGLISGTPIEERLYDMFMPKNGAPMYGNEGMKLVKKSDSRSVLEFEDEPVVPIEEAGKLPGTEQDDKRAAYNIAQYLDVLILLAQCAKEFGMEQEYIDAIDQFFGGGETVRRSEDLNPMVAVYVGAAASGNKFMKADATKPEIIPYYDMWYEFSTRAFNNIDDDNWANTVGARNISGAQRLYWTFDFYENPLFTTSKLAVGDGNSLATGGVSSSTRKIERYATFGVDDTQGKELSHLPAENVVGRATSQIGGGGGGSIGPFFFVYPIIFDLNPSGGFTHSITATPDGSSTSKFIDVQPSSGTLDKTPTVEYRIGTGFDPENDNIAYSDPTYTEQLQMLFESLDSRGATYEIKVAFWRAVMEHTLNFDTFGSSWRPSSDATMTTGVTEGIKTATKMGFDTSPVDDVNNAEPHTTDSASIMAAINSGVLIDYKEEAGTISELVEKANWPVIDGTSDVFRMSKGNVEYDIDIGGSYKLRVEYFADTQILVEIDGEKYELNYDGHKDEYALVAYKAKEGVDLEVSPLNLPVMFAKDYPDTYKFVSDSIGYDYFNEGKEVPVPASPEIDIKVWTPFAVYSSTPEAYAELKNWGIASRTEPGDTWRGEFVGGKDGDTTDTFTGFPGDNGDGDKKNLAVVNDYGLFNDSRTGIGDTRVPLDTGAGAGRTSDGTGIIGEDYEAMSGVPSTELLYLAVGGSEFIIDIAVQYVPNETAVRSYWARFNSVNCQYNYNNGTGSASASVEGVDDSAKDIVHGGAAGTSTNAPEPGDGGGSRTVWINEWDHNGGIFEVRYKGSINNDNAGGYGISIADQTCPPSCGGGFSTACNAHAFPNIGDMTIADQALDDLATWLLEFYPWLISDEWNWTDASSDVRRSLGDLTLIASHQDNSEKVFVQRPGYSIMTRDGSVGGNRSSSPNNTGSHAGRRPPLSSSVVIGDIAGFGPVGRTSRNMSSGGPWLPNLAYTAQAYSAGTIFIDDGCPRQSVRDLTVNFRDTRGSAGANDTDGDGTQWSVQPISLNPTGAGANGSAITVRPISSGQTVGGDFGDMSGYIEQGGGRVSASGTQISMSIDRSMDVFAWDACEMVPCHYNDDGTIRDMRCARHYVDSWTVQADKVDWEIGIRIEVAPHVLCGPCCEHVLPDIHNVWQQTFNYDYTKIIGLSILRLDQGAARDMSAKGTGLKALIGTDAISAVRHTFYSGPIMHFAQANVFDYMGMQTDAQLDVMHASDEYYRSNAYGYWPELMGATKSSEAGRVRYFMVNDNGSRLTSKGSSMNGGPGGLGYAGYTPPSTVFAPRINSWQRGASRGKNISYSSWPDMTGSQGNMSTGLFQAHDFLYYNYGGRSNTCDGTSRGWYFNFDKSAWTTRAQVAPGTYRFMGIAAHELPWAGGFIYDGIGAGTDQGAGLTSGYYGADDYSQIIAYHGFSVSLSYRNDKRNNTNMVPSNTGINGTDIGSDGHMQGYGGISQGGYFNVKAVSSSGQLLPSGRRGRGWQGIGIYSQFTADATAGMDAAITEYISSGSGGGPSNYAPLNHFIYNYERHVQTDNRGFNTYFGGQSEWYRIVEAGSPDVFLAPITRDWGKTHTLFEDTHSTYRGRTVHPMLAATSEKSFAPVLYVLERSREEANWNHHLQLLKGQYGINSMSFISTPRNAFDMDGRRRTNDRVTLSVTGTMQNPYPMSWGNNYDHLTDFEAYTNARQGGGSWVQATPEWQLIHAHKRERVQATVISDVLMLVTPDGLQSVLYHYKNSQEDTVPPTQWVLSNDRFPDARTPFEEMWEDSDFTPAYWEFDDSGIYLGSYQGMLGGVDNTSPDVTTRLRGRAEPGLSPLIARSSGSTLAYLQGIQGPGGVIGSYFKAQMVNGVNINAYLDHEPSKRGYSTSQPMALAATLVDNPPPKNAGVGTPPVNRTLIYNVTPMLLHAQNRAYQPGIAEAFWETIVLWRDSSNHDYYGHHHTPTGTSGYPDYDSLFYLNPGNEDGVVVTVLDDTAGVPKINDTAVSTEAYFVRHPDLLFNYGQHIRNATPEKVTEVDTSPAGSGAAKVFDRWSYERGKNAMRPWFIDSRGMDAIGAADAREAQAKQFGRGVGVTGFSFDREDGLTVDSERYRTVSSSRARSGVAAHKSAGVGTWRNTYNEAVHLTGIQRGKDRMATTGAVTGQTNLMNTVGYNMHNLAEIGIPFILANVYSTNFHTPNRAWADARIIGERPVTDNIHTLVSGFIQRAAYTRSDGNSDRFGLNGVVVHTPVTAVPSLILPVVEWRDQRVAGQSYVTASREQSFYGCPGLPGLCKFSKVDCKFEVDMEFLNLNLTKDGGSVMAAYPDGIANSAADALNKNNIVLLGGAQNGIPLGALGATYNSFMDYRVELTNVRFSTLALDTGEPNEQMLFSFTRYGVTVDNTGTVRVRMHGRAGHVEYAGTRLTNGGSLTVVLHAGNALLSEVRINGSIVMGRIVGGTSSTLTVSSGDIGTHFYLGEWNSTSTPRFTATNVAYSSIKMTRLAGRGHSADCNTGKIEHRGGINRHVHAPSCVGASDSTAANGLVAVLRLFNEGALTEANLENVLGMDIIRQLGAAALAMRDIQYGDIMSNPAVSWRTIPAVPGSGAGGAPSVWVCDGAFNVHICIDCIGTSYDACTERHHYGLHYENDLCLVACMNNDLHNKYFVDDGRVSSFAAEWVSIDWDYTYYASSVDDMRDSTAYELGGVRAQTGRGYYDDMDLIKWFRGKYVRFPWYVLYDGILYEPYTWITLGERGVYSSYNLYINSDTKTSFS